MEIIVTTLCVTATATAISVNQSNNRLSSVVSKLTRTAQK